MRGVEVGCAQFRMRLRVEANGAHEAERLGDPVSEFLVALGLRAVLDETQHPAMNVLEIGVAAAGEGAQKVEGRRRLAIGFELPARIGLARLARELDVVDDVAAISRQGHAVDRLEVGRAGLGELARDPADLHDGRSGGESHDHSHLQEHAEEIANVVGRVLAEAFGAIPALQKEGLAGRRLAQRPFELARLACKNQRRIAGELALGLGQRCAIGIDRRLRNRLRPPAIRGPTLIKHNPALGGAAGRRSLSANRSIYSPMQGRYADFRGRRAFYRTYSARDWRRARAHAVRP